MCDHIRASILVVLNNYIAIFSTTKYENVPYNDGAKVIFFGSKLLLAVHCNWKVKKKKLCIHNIFYYFTYFYSFFFSYFSSSTFTLLLFVCSHFFTHFFFFFYIAFTLLYIVCAFTLLLFFYSYIFSFLIYCFFDLCVHITIVVDILFYYDVYIILLC